MSHHNTHQHHAPQTSEQQSFAESHQGEDMTGRQVHTGRHHEKKNDEERKQKQHIQVKATHSGTEPTGGSSRLQIPIHRNDFHKHYVHQDHTHHDDDPQQCKSANNCHHEKYDHPFLAPGHPTTVSQIRAACDERRTHEDIVNHSPYLQSIVNQHDDDLVHHKTHKSYRNQQQAYQQQQDKRH